MWILVSFPSSSSIGFVMRPKNSPHIWKDTDTNIGPFSACALFSSMDFFYVVVDIEKNEQKAQSLCVRGIHFNSETMLIPHLKFNFCFCLYAWHFIGARALGFNNVFRLLIFVYALTRSFLHSVFSQYTYSVHTPTHSNKYIKWNISRRIIQKAENIQWNTDRRKDRFISMCVYIYLHIIDRGQILGNLNATRARGPFDQDTVEWTDERIEKK